MVSLDVTPTTSTCTLSAMPFISDPTLSHGYSIEADPLNLKPAIFRGESSSAGNTINNAVTPDVLSLTFEYEQKLPVRYSYSFVIDVRNAYKGRTTKTMLEDLETAVEASTKVEFNYKASDPDLPEYVDAVNIQAVEKSGFTEEGFWQVTVVDR